MPSSADLPVHKSDGAEEDKTASDELAETYNALLHRYQLTEKSRVLCSFSGGADSSLLLHLLCEARETVGFQLTAFYLNHLLRGDESEQEECFVVRQLLKSSVPALLYQEDIETLAKQEKLSIETAARNCRKKIICTLMAEHRFTHIFTGHQQDDRAETLLYNLSRGAGLKGAGAMREYEPKTGLVRPLLSLRRDAIRKICKKKKIEYFEDKSNATNLYTRNRLRHQVLPLLEHEIHPQAVRSLARSASLFEEAEESIKAVVSLLASRYISRWGEMLLLKQAILNDTLCTPYVLKEVFKEMLSVFKVTVTYEHLVNLEKQFRNPPQKNGICGIWRQIECMYATEGLALFHHHCLKEWKEYQEKLKPERSVETAYFRIRLVLVTEEDANKHSITVQFPLTVHFRQGGERVLLQSGKEKPIKELFNEWKLPHFRRLVHPLIQIRTDVTVLTVSPKRSNKPCFCPLLIRNEGKTYQLEVLLK